MICEGWKAVWCFLLFIFAFFQRSVLCLSMWHLSINFKYFEPSTPIRFLCFKIALHIDLHVVPRQRHGCLRWQMKTLISCDPKWIEAPKPLSWILPASTLHGMVLKMVSWLCQLQKKCSIVGQIISLGNAFPQRIWVLSKKFVFQDQVLTLEWEFG